MGAGNLANCRFVRQLLHPLEKALPSQKDLLRNCIMVGIRNCKQRISINRLINQDFWLDALTTGAVLEICNADAVLYFKNNWLRRIISSRHDFGNTLSAVSLC